MISTIDKEERICDLYNIFSDSFEFVEDQYNMLIEDNNIFFNKLIRFLDDKVNFIGALYNGTGLISSYFDEVAKAIKLYKIDLEKYRRKNLNNHIKEIIKINIGELEKMWSSFDYSTDEYREDLETYVECIMQQFEEDYKKCKAMMIKSFRFKVSKLVGFVKNILDKKKPIILCFIKMSDKKTVKDFDDIISNMNILEKYINDFIDNFLEKYQDLFISSFSEGPDSIAQSMNIYFESL